MCTHNQCLSKNKKKIYIFHLKINIFTAVKYCCILHGRVCVINLEQNDRQVNSNFNANQITVMQV